TTIGFGLLGAGILTAVPDRGIVAAMRRPGLSGAVARRLIPAAFVVPVIIGFLRLRGQQLGFYGTEAGIAIFAIANVIIMVLLIIWCANSLATLEEASERGREELRRQSQLIDLANDAIITADASRNITKWNGGAQKLYGWTETEALGQL